LVPGGWAPDKLRRYPEVIQFVQEMDKADKTIAQICHAGWVLVSADILKGRKVTSTPGIKDDMTNAGAEWTNEHVVVDGNHISSRRPKDLPAYGKAIADKMAEYTFCYFLITRTQHTKKAQIFPYKTPHSLEFGLTNGVDIINLGL